MAGLKTIFDFFRDAAGTGINSAAWTLKKLVDDATITSGSTASDPDPSVALAGMISIDETTLTGYPGPLKYSVTDPTTGAVRIHTSKSIGVVGAWRTIDIPRAWRAMGTGVQPGVGNELAVTTTGTNMVISTNTGSAFIVMGDYALFYSYPSSQTLTGVADGSNPRVSTVILRAYPPGVEEEGRIILALLAGTPAASPVAATLHQSTDYWEFPLRDIPIPAGATTLAVGTGTDRRVWSFVYPNSIVAGDTLHIDDNSKIARLPKGTSGQFYKQGATIPAWASITVGDIANAFAAKTTDYTATANDSSLTFDATGAARILTLPNGAGLNIGHTFVVKKIDVSANGLTIDGNASELIDNDLTITLYGMVSVTIKWNGTKWLIVEGRDLINGRVDVRWFGALAYAPGTAHASMTNSTAAINTAAAVALAIGGVVTGRGRYRVDATVTIACDADFTGAEFVCNDTAIAPVVRIGTTTASTAVNRLRVVAPRIIQAAKTGTGWTGTSLGVELANLHESDVTVPYVKYFTTGLLLKTYGTMGVAYNTIHVGQLDNNKVNCQLAPTDTNGWTNENLFIGGQYNHETAEGDAVSGTRHVLLTGIGTSQPNNNLWVRASLESADGSGGGSVSIVEYMIESISGIYNRWIQCRYEGPTPKISWDQVSATRFSRDNVIEGGYNAEGIAFTVSANSVRNWLVSPVVQMIDGGSANGVIRGSNGNTDTTGLRWYDLSTPVLTAGADDWRWDWAASQVRMKAKSDTVARLSIATGTGTMSWGPGSGAADTNLYRNAADVLKTDDSFHVALSFRHLGTTLGFFGQAAASRAAALTQGYATADRTLSAYTSDLESSAYTGAADGEAKLTDLNTLRVAYENLRAFAEDLAAFVNSLVDDMQGYGLEQ